MVLTIELFARSLSELPHLRQLRFFTGIEQEGIF